MKEYYKKKKLKMKKSKNTKEDNQLNHDKE